MMGHCPIRDRQAPGGLPVGRATNGEALATEHADLVTAAAEGEAGLSSNGGPETSISTPVVELDVAPRTVAPLDPPTEDTPH